MQCESVNGRCCGIGGCTSVSVENLNGDFDAYATEISCRMDVGVQLVCKTGQGAWEYLFVEEGQVLDINGEKLMVRRY